MQAIERNWGTKYLVISDNIKGKLKGPYTAQKQGDHLIQRITSIPRPYLTQILSSEKDISLVYMGFDVEV